MFGWNILRCLFDSFDLWCHLICVYFCLFYDMSIDESWVFQLPIVGVCEWEWSHRLIFECLVYHWWNWLQKLRRLVLVEAGVSLRFQKPIPPGHGMVAHAFVVHGSPSSQEAEAGRSQWVQGQPDLHSEFQDSLGYVERHCLKKMEKNLQIKRHSQLAFCLLPPICRIRSKFSATAPTPACCQASHCDGQGLTLWNCKSPVKYFLLYVALAMCLFTETESCCD